MRGCESCTIDRYMSCTVCYPDNDPIIHSLDNLTKEQKIGYTNSAICLNNEEFVQCRRWGAFITTVKYVHVDFMNMRDYVCIVKKNIYVTVNGWIK